MPNYLFYLHLFYSPYPFVCQKVKSTNAGETHTHTIKCFCLYFSSHFMYCCRLSEVEQNEKIYDPLTADAPTGYYSVSEWNKPPEVATNKITNKKKNVRTASGMFALRFLNKYIRIFFSTPLYESTCCSPLAIFVLHI